MIACRSFFIALSIPALLLIPFIFHRSQFPEYGPYSSKYLLLITTGLAIAVIFSALIAWYCQRKKTDALAKNISISWLALISALVGLEFILRQTSYNDEFREYKKNGQQKSLLYGYENLTSAQWTDAGIRHSTDSRGYRIHTRKPEWFKDRSDTRIFALGGSSTFGYRLPDSKTWPDLLDNAIARDNKEVTLINAGNNGYNSVQVLLKNYFKIAQDGAQYILIYQNRNDAQERPLNAGEVFVDKEIVFSSSLVDYLKEKGERNFYLQSVTGHMLKTTLGNYFLRTERMARVDSGISSMPENQIKELNLHNGRRYARNLRALVTLSRLENIEPVFITFLHNPQGMESHKSALIGHLNTVMRGVSKEIGVPLIDLAKKFSRVKDKSPYFQDDGYHPTKVGAQLIAEKTLAELTAIINGNYSSP